MKNSSVLFSIFLMTLVASCGENKKGAINSEENGMQVGTEEVAKNKNLDDAKATGDAKFKDEKTAAIYEDYLAVKSALVNTNAQEAKKGAENLIETLKSAKRTGDAVTASTKIATTDDINEQRTAFSDLSAAMGNLVSGALASGEIYKQYCPMAFQGEGGYWLTNSKEVRNPYYGNKMLKCGRVAETIE